MLQNPLGTSVVSPVSQFVTLISLLSLCYLLSVVRWRSRSRGLPLPPGPKGLPFIGNLFNIPSRKAWFGNNDNSAVYGNIIHYRVLRQSIVVLNDPDTISQYLNKRSANTSSRLQSPLIELTGMTSNFGLMPYGQRWRQHRRVFAQMFHPEAIVDYHSAQRSAAHKLLKTLLYHPSNLEDDLRRTFIATIFKVVYGISIRDNDGYTAIAEGALRALTAGLTPGKFLVQHVTFLRHLPSWFPGTGWKRVFDGWKNAVRRLENEPFAHVQHTMETESDGYDCVASRCIEEIRKSGHSGSQLESELGVAKSISAVAIQGGSDTTVCAFRVIFFALALYPNVLRKAHEELDAVVGPDRLPEFGDRPSLVYIRAIIMESLRFHSITPMGTPHCTVDDDEFHGYFIPAGTVVQANVWACMHDPEVFPDPLEFRPERFIRDGKYDAGPRDPMDYAFGFGRRICPGMHFAMDNLFINVASTLHVFDISAPCGEDGMPAKMRYDNTDGLVSYPMDYKYTIKPRSKEAEWLIRQST